MKKSISLIFSLSLLNSSTLTVTNIKEKNNDLYVLNLQSKDSFSCSIENSSSLKDKIKCNITNFDKNITKDSKYFNLILSPSLLSISPKYNYKIYKKDSKIYDKLNFSSTSKTYNSIDILFYKKDTEYVTKQENIEHLAFDINYEKLELDIINVLKDDLKPILNSANADRINYIQELFDAGKYDSVLDNCRRLLKDNDTLFKNELVLFKIRAMDKLLSSHLKVKFSYDTLDLVVDDFLDSFPSDKNLPEVLYYKVKTAFKNGRYTKAIPHVDKLSKNFSDNKFTHLAEILKAEKLFIKRDGKFKAIKLLKNVLYKTKYQDIALKSAYALIKNYIILKNSKQARFYLDKILNSNKEYLNHDFKESFSLAKKFSKEKDYASANDICKILIVDNKDELLYKNYANWLEKDNKKDLAYKIYKKYIREYQEGIYIDLIKEKIDKVLLDVNETNSSKQHEDIDIVMKNYKDDPIYKKALIKKVRLYQNEKKYSNILDLESKLKDINQTSYVDSAASSLFRDYIYKKRCKDSINLVDRYKISVDTNLSYELTKCYFAWARYRDANAIVDKQISDIDITNKAKWLYLGIKTSNRVGKYSKSISMFNDLEKLININEQYSDILYIIFDSQYKLNKIEDAILVGDKIKVLYPNSPQTIDVYDSIVKYAYKNKNDSMLELYAIRLLKLQKRLKVQTYSPRVDLLLIQALGRLNKYKKALSYFADAILTKTINDTEKAQLLYLAGELSLKLNNQEQAKEFFIKCGTDIKNSMWQKLCSDSLKLLD